MEILATPQQLNSQIFFFFICNKQTQLNPNPIVLSIIWKQIKKQKKKGNNKFSLKHENTYDSSPTVT